MKSGLLKVIFSRPETLVPAPANIDRLFLRNHQPMPLEPTAGYDFWRIPTTSGAEIHSSQSVGKTVVTTPMAEPFQKLGPTGEETEVDNKWMLETLSVEILCILLERRLAEESSDLDEARSCKGHHQSEGSPDRRQL